MNPSPNFNTTKSYFIYLVPFLPAPGLGQYETNLKQHIISCKRISVGSVKNEIFL